MRFTGIPDELRAIPHWCAAGSRNDPGRPVDPKTGNWASVNDPSTWGTFEEAERLGYPFVGIVLTPDDPYTVIDLDDKPHAPLTEGDKMAHDQIIRLFSTYCERSKGGRGFHLIMRGAAPNRKRKAVEVYSHSRFMICTGNRTNDLPITEQHANLAKLVAEMPASKGASLDESGDEILADSELFDMAISAENGDKFERLTRGDWKADYSSQSEADLALVSMLCFYSRSNAQVRRIFRASPLGQRDKAIKNNTYIDFTISRARGSEPPPIDASQLVVKGSDVTSTDVEVAPQNANAEVAVPGFLSTLVEAYYAMSIRPVKDVSTAAAIGLMAGVLGRCYNISGTGLNQYLLLLAKTGTGKESMLNCVDRTIAQIRQTIPAADDFIGPAAFASGQALIKTLCEKPSFVSVLGEFGLTLQQLSAKQAGNPDIMFKRVLLDLYGKSGWGRSLRSSAYSDSEKNTKIVASPALTILGESTPETFLETMQASHITEGLIPRFLIINYNGPRPPRNESPAAELPEPVMAWVVNLVTIALTMKQNNQCVNIAVSTDADTLFSAFDKACDAAINRSAEAEAHLWNRAHLKALKLAGLSAVCDNPHNPVVSTHAAQWAIYLVRKDIESMTSKFSAGEVGSADSKQTTDLRRIITQYFDSDADTTAKKYAIPKTIIDAKVLPYAYVQRRSACLSSFRNDRLGSTQALLRVIQDLIATGELRELPAIDKVPFKTTGRMFYVIKQG